MLVATCATPSLLAHMEMKQKKLVKDLHQL